MQDSHLLSPLRSLGCRTGHCNKSVVESADVVFVATKPNVVPKYDKQSAHTIWQMFFFHHNFIFLLRVLEEVAAKLKANTLLVSIAAGVTIQQLEQMTNVKSKVDTSQRFYRIRGVGYHDAILPKQFI